MNLIWRASESATVLHLAAAIAQGLPLTDPRFGPAVAVAATSMHDELLRAGRHDEGTWTSLCAAACQHPDVGDAIRATVPMADAKDVEATQRVDRIVEFAQEVAAGVRRVLPGLNEELRHRSRPLREQWEARGPGFLRALLGKAGTWSVPEQVSVFLVHPVLGGGGEIDRRHAALWIEALLANTLPGLPEVVRLGWLLGQLACQHGLPTSHPRMTDEILRRDRTIALALVPAALAAAEVVELGTCNAETVHHAIVAWRLAPLPAGLETERSEPPGDDVLAAARTAECVWTWWQTQKLMAPGERDVVALHEPLWE